MSRVLLRLVIASLALAAAQPARSAPPLTVDGWGGLRIGMTESEATRRFGLKRIEADDVYSDECRELKAPGQGQLLVMVENGRITRISLVAAGPLKTDRGLGPGSTEAQVRQVYGAKLKVEPNFYEGFPASYLTFWAGKGRGVRFETDAHRRVTRLHVGGGAIEYVEGCL